MPRGFVLLPVVFAITLVAALAFLLGRGGPMALELAAGDSRERLALRVAEAGMAHAVWRADRAGCTDYALGDTTFGDHRYSASYSATSGSPVDVTVTATLADGATRSLLRRNVAIHQTEASINLDAVDDTYLDQRFSNSNTSGSNKLYIETDTPGWDYRSLLRFNLAVIPFGARIVSASLSLKLISGNAAPVAVRRVVQDWNPVQVTWNARRTGINWNRPGGDMDLASVSTATVGGSGSTRYSWDVTALVAGWTAGTYASTYLGLELAGADATAFLTLSSLEDNNPANRPRLSITYACDCGSVCTAPQGTGKVLLVVGEGGSPSSDDQYRKGLFESWGYTVTYLDDSDSQSSFDTALGSHDVAYVSETVGIDLGSKLLSTGKGVVYEEGGQNGVLGLATGFGQAVGSGVTIIDNSHEITQPFATGALAIYQRAMEGLKAAGTLAGGAQILARWGGDAGLIALDKGAAKAGGGTAAGRRVMLPLGRVGKFNLAYLNNNGRLIVQRALDWAKAAPADPLAVGLLAHWKLDDGSGNKALDSVGGHDGDLKNGPTWTTGQLNGALRFDGLDDRVLVPDSPTLDITDAITLSAWIQPRAVGTEYVVRKTLYGSDDGYELSLSTTGKVFFRLNQRSNGDTYRIESASSYPSNGSTWMHIAATYDGAQMRLYINGVQEAGMAASVKIGSNNRDLSIGAQTDGSRGLQGTIDDVRLYDRALDAAEVAQLAAPPGGGGGGGCSGTLRDEFNAQSYTGSDGTLAWAGNWTEVNESDGAGSGDEIVGTDQSNYQLRVQDNDGGGEGVMRQADLSAFLEAELSFDYRRVGLDDVNDYVVAQVSKDGGAWVELGRFKGSGTDAGYTPVSYGISAYIGASTRIRFLTSPTMGGSDAVWFDNVQITAGGCAP